MLVFAALALATAAVLPSGPFAMPVPIVQGAETPDPCSLILHAWVDPVFGVDHMGVSTSGSPIRFFAQVNDPTAPFKTIQAAIDALENHIVTAFNAGNTTVEGLVIAMPGMYGPAVAGGPPANGEFFPIIMRDRVHVQGQGARGCVIRGILGVNFSPTTPVFFPTVPNPPTHAPFRNEVLVDYSFSSKFTRNFVVPLPWVSLEETSEMLDGFTFQGGEIQVMFYKDNSTQVAGSPELRGRISNCLFDMRDDWPITSDINGVIVAGPHFGIQMVKQASAGGNLSCPSVGYADQKVLIANNTFVFCELGMLDEQLLVKSSSKAAVGIMDVTDSGCNGFITADPDNTPRGVGNPIIVNNLFRTTPDVGATLSRSFAMLGIDANDTLAGTS